jgi:hypothetical protein
MKKDNMGGASRTLGRIKNYIQQFGRKTSREETTW